MVKIKRKPIEMPQVMLETANMLKGVFWSNQSLTFWLLCKVQCEEEN